MSLEVLATEEGKSRNVGKLGALICEGVDDGNIKVNVGSGLSDAQRDEFWTDKDKLIGMVAEVRADAVPQNPRWFQDSLRFPRSQTFSF